MSLNESECRDECGVVGCPDDVECRYSDKVTPVALFEKKLLIGEGHKEYCLACLPLPTDGSEELYALWLINNGHAAMKPIGKCSHK